MFITVAIVAARALVAVVPANAVTILTLYNTGVDAGGVATTRNSADLYWTLGNGTADTGAINGVFPIVP